MKAWLRQADLPEGPVVPEGESERAAWARLTGLSVRRDHPGPEAVAAGVEGRGSGH